MRATTLDRPYSKSLENTFKLHSVRSLTTSRGASTLVHAGPRRQNSGNGSGNGPTNANKRPDSGFFADVDPKGTHKRPNLVLTSNLLTLCSPFLHFFIIFFAATIYPVRSSLQQDPTKRGGRWQSDFIWNSNWKDALDYEESLRKQVEEGRREAADGDGPGGDGKGFLSLTSKVDLNSMEVDLSQQLKPRPKPQKSAGSGLQPPSNKGGYPQVPATRGEVRAWDRSGRYSRKVVAITPTEQSAEEIAAQVAAETARYEELKRELQMWAMGLTAASLVATAVFYGRDVAASYGVGALGGLIYLRLLHRSVDGIGYGGIGAALGQNRLLIPIILALGFNRYNLLFADSTGLTLQLLPILVGFFTYKGAVIARQSLVLFGDLSASYRESNKQEGGDNDSDGGMNGEQGGDGEGIDVLSVDRAFNKRMLSG